MCLLCVTEARNLGWRSKDADLGWYVAVATKAYDGIEVGDILVGQANSPDFILRWHPEQEDVTIYTTYPDESEEDIREAFESVFGTPEEPLDNWDDWMIGQVKGLITEPLEGFLEWLQRY
jgi:hypothetical protein